MEYYQIGAGILHAISRKILLFKLLWDKTCRGVSLITQELFLVVYITRYLDLLYLYESFTVELIKVAHLVAALAIVLLIRYSPMVASSYDADLDTMPRAALLIPPFLLALLFNKVVLIIEILHQFSFYLEAVALIPQFVLLYRRQKYESWVLLYTIFAGLEVLVRNIPKFMGWRLLLKQDLYGLCAASVQAVVFLGGLVLVMVGRVETARQEGLNEAASKPAFDEEWQAGKFEFQEGAGQQQAKSAAVKS